MAGSHRVSREEEGPACGEKETSTVDSDKLSEMWTVGWWEGGSEIRAVCHNVCAEYDYHTKVVFFVLSENNLLSPFINVFFFFFFFC